jgi:FixJ family two-component response regulator
LSDQIGILCVDDERNVLRSLERVFLDEEYQILTARSGEEALELLAVSPQVQLVISDFRIPGMNGVDFLREVFLRHPETIRIVLSGYADTAAVVEAINEGKIYRFIPKPWNDDELRMTVAKALEHFSVRRKNLLLADELRLKNRELKELNANLERLVEQRTSQLLLQNRALLHARIVLDHLPFGVLGLTTDGIVMQVNQEAAHLLNLAPELMLGEPMGEVLPPELCELARLVGAEQYCLEVELTRKERLRAKGMTMAEGGQSGIILTVARAAQLPA